MWCAGATDPSLDEVAERVAPRFQVRAYDAARSVRAPVARAHSEGRKIAVNDDLASANVNRTYSLAATSIAIFTFTMIFLYPRYANGEVDASFFQVTLAVMAVATFSYVFSSFHYYGASMGDRISEAERATYARRADRLWLLGTTLLFLVPSLILFTVSLLAVALVWLALWLGYVVFVTLYFPRVQTPKKN